MFIRSNKRKFSEWSDINTDPNNHEVNNGNNMQRISQSNNSLGIRLFSSRIKKEESPKNVLISPYSLGSALVMLALGATGESFDQLKNALDWNSIKKGGDEQNVVPFYTKALQELGEVQDVKLVIGNSVWTKRVFPDYIESVRHQLLAEVFPLNTAEEINRWVSEKTQGLIKEIVDEVRPDQFAVLVNAIYFKGSWEYPFSPYATSKKDFHFSDGSIRKVKTMHLTQFFGYKKTNEYTSVELPYKGEGYAMIAILPHGTTSASEFSKNLTLDDLFEFSCGLSKRKQVRLSLPKFKVEYGVVEMKESLKDINVTRIYSEKNAQLDRLSDGDAHMGAILHKAVCIVSEEGTEAAAVTAVTLRCPTSKRRSPPEIIDVKFDRPFLFMIQDVASELILFLGLVEDPSKL